MNQFKINLFKPVCSTTEFKNSEILHCAHIAFMYFIWYSKETLTFALHNINRYFVLKYVFNLSLAEQLFPSLWEAGCCCAYFQKRQ